MNKAYVKRMYLLLETEIEIERLNKSLKEYRKELKNCQEWQKENLYPSYKFADVKRKSIDLSRTMAKLRATKTYEY